MLLSFSVGNFRSFREKQTLSMVASNRHADHREHLREIPFDSNMALPVAALYGANGAGKSNLVKALVALKGLVSSGTEMGRSIPRNAFVLDQESASSPTEFELQFLAKGKAYVYGAKLMDDRVAEEWLSELQNGSETSIFQRSTDASLVTGIEYHAKLTGASKLDALRVVQGPPNQLFLHVIRTNLTGPDRGPSFEAVLDWFEDRLLIIEPDAMYGNLCSLLEKDASFAKFAGHFLQKVATGVDELTVDTSEVKEEGKGALDKLFAGGRRSVSQGETAVERDEQGKVFLHEVKSQHLTARGQRVDLPLKDESDGTRRLLHLLPALHLYKGGEGTVFVIDEIDRSLHPLLAKEFVRAFLKECAGKGSQIIFSTHDTNLLDPKLLRRDEIWFAEKKLPAGATELYSLSDFKVRTDLKFDKAYLEARFGAVPPIPELPEWVTQIMQDLQPGYGHGKDTAG
jgi:uncharacterized protein